MTPTSASCWASPVSPTKPGVNGPIGDPGEHVADERRQPEAVGEEAEREGDDHGRDDGGEELGGVRHGVAPRR